MKTNNLTLSRNVFGGVHYTTEHTGKMKRVFSVSTDINSNPFCQARQMMIGCICHSCYAERMLDDTKGVFRTANKAFKQNGEILCSRLLDDSEIPTIDAKRHPIFRFQAFADIRNVTEVLNYLKMARKNPKVRFALWTKNIGIVAQALKIVPKPKNVQIVLSSLKVNEDDTFLVERFPFVDKVFTVYDDAHIAQGVDINCGARSCFGCQRCYKPNPKGVSLMQVRERLK